MKDWVVGKVVNLKHWNEYLFTLIINASIKHFIAGQFTKLGMIIDGKRVFRAYSYVNSPDDSNLEFYLINVKNGKLSSCLHSLKIGEEIMVRERASGFFVLDSIPDCKNLWMLATGTAIGPYLSILRHSIGLNRFQNIVLVHAVRFFKDLSYLSNMFFLQKKLNNLKIQTIVSREKCSGSLMGRIPNLILEGTLESKVNISLNSQDSHVMLCGNPYMIQSTRVLLENTRGMKRNLKNSPGNITTEQYW
ncbi:Ferredoxin-NADP reductase [Candidatus Westeberhardia cardiocondylae]|uniref:Flavodoxin/ferredoxin--NADP reductase n=1 Tax=Candidatus Westeberhardia cardiocondylae TaxID=1594731 RepID=A0A0H5C5A9_9ENTR|nr:FAD-binding oxidoreductase [Candidatus Westeberhardia cardiocondylae]CEN32121.1 Ferredoxin-NADP reductase [Candidatus Westeberhardia cardiocondylae]